MSGFRSRSTWAAAILIDVNLLLIAACFVALAAGPESLGAQSTASPSASRDSLIARADRGRIKGSKDAIWMIVISDFQCPFCKRWHEETAPRIEREYVATGKIQIAYMNLPLPSIHPNAPAAHDAAMCAAEQGKFWPMADALFASQNEWKGRRDAAAYFDSLAGTLPLDRARLRSCIRDGGLRALIDADVDRATRSGAGSTPHFFIGGRAIIGAQPYEAFKSAIEAALAAAPSKPTP